MLIWSFISTGAESQSPYVGQEQRELKTLSDTEIQGYLDGSGMGLAKVAELNRYPGPKHVLKLADEIGLSDEQKTQTERLYGAMKRRASGLGQRLVEKERKLDQLFETRSITPTQLTVQEVS
jgi:hypothetical protein